MAQRKYPAVFMRGGTSKAILFHARDLPAARGSFYRTARRLFEGYVCA